MKSILIDELIEIQTSKQQTIVEFNNSKLTGWQIAKPLNYEKKYTSFINRLKSAFKVLRGKSIAVHFFTDLSEADRIKYVKTKLQKK